uniref:Col_cuticle_N domain-containing protein n=1 Tax=Strongyloides papillosus TaxID=174720 RepID=A0A0N5BCZ7_STREA
MLNFTRDSGVVDFYNSYPKAPSHIGAYNIFSTVTIFCMLVMAIVILLMSTKFNCRKRNVTKFVNNVENLHVDKDKTLDLDVISVGKDGTCKSQKLNYMEKSPVTVDYSKTFPSTPTP